MNYKSLLSEINNAAMASTLVDAIVVPSNKQLYNVDLNTRKIEAPEVLSIQSEHYAETVYFLVDRFYDNMDLAQTNCVIQYTTGTKSYVYAVPFCDYTTYPDKLIIPWSISISATEVAGSIKFFMRFYLIAPESLVGADGNYTNEHPEFSYSLSTLVGTSKVLKTLPQDDFHEEDDSFNVPEQFFELANLMAKLADNATVYWIDV